jgi:protein-tyrosine phosphatase
VTTDRAPAKPEVLRRDGHPITIGPVRILTVCTHNRTRSVLAAALLQHKLAQAGIDATVDSAGFGPEGMPATPETVELLRRAGIDAAEHLSRRATGELVRQADLIIGAERQHVVRLVVEEGADFRRVFTLPELRTRLDGLGTLPAPDLAAALELLNQGRPRGGAYLQNDVPEVHDPTGGPPSEWEQAWYSIDAACTRVGAFLQRLTG